MVLEAVTKLAFDEYIKLAVFDVCGMEATGYFALDRLPARCAHNYIYCADTDDYRTNIYSVDAKGTGAGGAFVTVKDIVRFWTGLLDGKLLSKALATEMPSRFLLSNQNRRFPSLPHCPHAHKKTSFQSIAFPPLFS